MKKIYLALLALTFAITTQAQRKCDLGLSGGITSTSITIDATGGTPTYFNLGITNNGSDTLKVTDTIYLIAPLYTGSTAPVVLYPTSPIAPGITVSLKDTFYYTSSGSPDGTYTFCDSLWLRSAASNPSIDLVLSNDKVCQAVPIVTKTTSIAEVEKKQTLTTYPNPAVNELSFEFDFLNNSDATARVFDLAGHTVFVKEFEKNYVGNQKFNLDISALNTGVYFLEFVVGDTKSISKFNVQK